ncbi:YlbD family protein [Alkalihalobacterium alkalinitrilicum]|uniref:YlbD family protein n=1 Tax=Alkalihalobacterium alkalinitrilicum TaxID=427920 RepID=UPI0013032165|nr:YlbD family protein [Alkalihalobacterium alkalinitrilicum]
MTSNSKNLHPSIQQFKMFVKQHPLLIHEVRNGNKTWQDFYEEWTLLGEEHPNWEPYRRAANQDTYNTNNNTGNNGNFNTANDTNNSEENGASSSSETTSTNILGLLKNINFNDLQHHMAQVSSVISNVQGLMQSFQGKNQTHQPQRPDDPFSFRRH